jgi:hypothetical protein
MQRYQYILSPVHFVRSDGERKIRKNGLTQDTAGCFLRALVSLESSCESTVIPVDGNHDHHLNIIHHVINEVNTEREPNSHVSLHTCKPLLPSSLGMSIKGTRQARNI